MAKIHHRKWHKKLKRRELRYIWSKIDVSFTFADSVMDYQGLPNIMRIMKRYLP